MLIPDVNPRMRACRCDLRALGEELGLLQPSRPYLYLEKRRSCYAQANTIDFSPRESYVNPFEPTVQISQEYLSDLLEIEKKQ